MFARPPPLRPNRWQIQQLLADGVDALHAELSHEFAGLLRLIGDRLEQSHLLDKQGRYAVEHFRDKGRSGLPSELVQLIEGHPNRAAWLEGQTLPFRGHWSQLLWKV
jgi:hypothetical protein